jgi:uncharacterized repeat protein (TIGR03803 family)
LGAVFALNRAGKQTVLHDSKGGTDGAFPYGGVVRDSAGNLYGTTSAGGGRGCGGGGCGTVFKLNRRGNETLLYSFTGGTDGGTPYAGLIRDAARNLYGTALVGGATGNGVVFKISEVHGELAEHVEGFVDEKSHVGQKFENTHRNAFRLGRTDD